MLTYNDITKNEAIKTYIIRADESLGALGFTEHSFAHVMLQMSQQLLQQLETTMKELEFQLIQ